MRRYFENQCISNQPRTHMGVRSHHSRDCEIFTKQPGVNFYTLVIAPPVIVSLAIDIDGLINTAVMFQVNNSVSSQAIFRHMCSTFPRILENSGEAALGGDELRRARIDAEHFDA